MATPIEYTNIKPQQFVTSSSRYVNSDVILYGENKTLTFTTYKRQPVEFTDSDMFTVIPPGEEYRPDLTSFHAYGTVDFWWRIMEANQIFDIYDYKAGLSIRIPTPFNL